ncbi:MAG: peptidylprolyl isomerase [Syntrophobacterales bacterium]|jgi:parvulin-like peptidyl-prolyl isomerase|nr:peptidylprolyl isomerase [Syntrophobacterales bacterium]
MGNWRKYLSIGLIFIFLGMVTACNQQDKKSQEENTPIATEPLIPEETMPDENVPVVPDMAGIVIMVDGVTLTKDALDKELNAHLNMMKGQIPANKLKTARADLRDQIINSFVVTTLLTNEAKKRNVAATEKEITEEINKLKGSLPPELSFETFLKDNNLTAKKLREKIGQDIQIIKLLKAAVPAAGKVTDKEINDFYRQNKDKFVAPEAVHARHILIKTEPEDDEQTIGTKKEKAESIRQELLEGVDFAQLANQHSDDRHSAQLGGDLGMFTRGQMVKPFETAAFSQKENDIGSIVKTEFGYHIIQVIKREEKKTMPLNDEIREQISSFLAMRKRDQANQNFVRKLQEKATIVVNRNA